MLKRIKVNLEAIEAMYYFWQAANDRENVSEKFFHDVGQMPAMTCMYDDEFQAESVRRTLSAIKNREPFYGNKKEKRFWNYNMWMMEDLQYTQTMIQPIKQLNLGELVEEVQGFENSDKYEEIEVIISPMHMDEYIMLDNKLLINFFRVKPSCTDDNTYIGETEIKEYIKEKIKELMSK